MLLTPDVDERQMFWASQAQGAVQLMMPASVDNSFLVSQAGAADEYGSCCEGQDAIVGTCWILDEHNDFVTFTNLAPAGFTQVHACDQRSHRAPAWDRASAEIMDPAALGRLSSAARRRLRRQKAATRRNALCMAERPVDEGETCSAIALDITQEAETCSADAFDNTQEEVRSMPDIDCEMILKQLEGGGDAAHSALELIRGHILELTLDATGCRVVQNALEIAGRSDAAAI